MNLLSLRVKSFSSLALVLGGGAQVTAVVVHPDTGSRKTEERGKYNYLLRFELEYD